MKANTREEFVRAWRSEVVQFAHLALQAGTGAGTGETSTREIEIYNGVYRTLEAMIERAADRSFPKAGA